jgi:hypothetical protein
MTDDFVPPPGVSPELGAALIRALAVVGAYKAGTKTRKQMREEIENISAACPTCKIDIFGVGD